MIYLFKQLQFFLLFGESYFKIQNSFWKNWGGRGAGRCVLAIFPFLTLLLCQNTEMLYSVWWKGYSSDLEDSLRKGDLG